MVELRDAAPADAHAIATVHVQSWGAAYRGLLPDAVLAGLSVAAREQSWFDILSAPQPRTRTVVATTDTTVLGFASIGPARDGESDPAAGELYAIYLDPDVWAAGSASNYMPSRCNISVRTASDGRACGSSTATNEPCGSTNARDGWTQAGRSSTADRTTSSCWSVRCTVPWPLTDDRTSATGARSDRGRPESWPECAPHR
jgi:hypothetical protein